MRPGTPVPAARDGARNGGAGGEGPEGASAVRGLTHQAGGMLWFRRNRFAGSYFAFSPASRR